MWSTDMFIRSERLFLRPGWPEDWNEILTQIDDEAVARNLATVPWPYTADHARAYAGLVQHPRCPHFLITVPTSLEPARVIGTIGLAPPLEAARADTGGDMVPELGYWIAKDHWGRGYATEAARAVLKLSATLGHRRISAAHFLDNPASGRVLRKAGFCPTGEVQTRFSCARGEPSASAIYAIELAKPGDCDDAVLMPDQRAA